MEYVIGVGGSVIMALIGLVYANLTAKIAENRRQIAENHRAVSDRLDRKNQAIQEILQKHVRLESEQTFQTKGLEAITTLINRRFDEVADLINDKVAIAVGRINQGKSNGN